MKHGNKIFCQPRGILAVIVLILIGNSIAGCKSYKKAEEETRTEFHCTGRDSTRVDSVLIRGNERSSQGDTTSVSADLHGSIEIKRDTVGRPVKIIWTRSALISTLAKRDKEKERWFYGLNASRHSESSGAVDSVSTKAEKITQIVDTRISLEKIIGPGLLLLVFIYLIYALVTEKILQWWKNRRAQ